MASKGSEKNTDSNITISCTSEYPDYTYNESHDIWALVSLVAPCYVEDSEDQRAAMDIVAVMDKSGSMAGEKLNLVKRTLEFVLTQLTEKDRLSLITYDTDVCIDFGLMNMTKENKQFAYAKIKNIHDGSMTNLSGGLIKGLTQIINRPSGGKNDIASVLLFTDGLANQGITSVEGIIAAMKDPKKFDGPAQSTVSHRNDPQAPAPHTSWLKKIFPGGAPKKSAEDISVVQETSRVDNVTVADAAVYTFGFGSDHDADMLKRISDAGNGMYYFIETEDKIGESFAHCLGGLMSTVAQGIQLEIYLEDGVTLKEVHTTRPCEKDGNRKVKVNVGDLQSEENRDIVLELSLGTVNMPYDSTPQPVLNVNVDYFSVVTNNLESATGKLSVLRPEKATVHDESRVNAKLVKERRRVDMTRVMKEAGDRAAVGDFEGTRVMLDQHIAQMKSCKTALTSAQNLDAEYLNEYDAMVEDLCEYQTTAADAYSWESKGRNLKSNLVQQYDNQRSNASEARAFNSKAKKSNVLKSKAFFK